MKAVLEMARAMLLPLLSLAAIVGVVYLVAQYWPGPHPGRMPDKIRVVYDKRLFQLHGNLSLDTVLFEYISEKDAQTLTEEEELRRRHHPPVFSDQWTSRFDNYFQKYTKRYFGVGFDWRWFKAQAIVESTLDPDAGSGAGAVGLMQILPSTYGDIAERRPGIGSLSQPRWNIAAGIAYMRFLYEKDALDDLDRPARLALSFASYNAGYSGMLNAMEEAPPEKVGWRDTLVHAPIQAYHYVYRIISVKTGVY